MYMKYVGIFKCKIFFFFCSRTDDLNLGDMGFQNAGAVCHTARETFTFLQNQFHGRVTSEEWHRSATEVLRSTPLDIFLCGRLKEKKSYQETSTIPELREIVRLAISEIELLSCESVMENSAKSIWYHISGVVEGVLPTLY